MKNLLYIIALVMIIGCRDSEPQGVTIEASEEMTLTKVEPPFWWAGMHDPILEVIFYHENIQDYQLHLNPYNGVKLNTVTKVENPNYLFAEFVIDENVADGTLELIFQKGDEKLRYYYELKARSTADDRVQGLDNSDVMYLLFPDRFSNGDPSNDNVEGMLQEVNRAEPLERHGGDIQGVINHLDYLKDLGVTAIWFNPLLENDQPHESYHGYAFTDHYNIDARFGGNEMYLKLVEECHKNGIKVIMDVVHNHVGDQHWMIKDLPMNDWIHQFDEFTKTTYRAPTLMDPYASKKDKITMSDGWFDTHMPDLNQDNPHVSRYLKQHNIWWVEYSGLDGLRIDTYAYPSPTFTSEWCKAILDQYPQIGMFGETWVHGPAVQAHFVANNGFRNAQNTHLPAVTDFQLHYAIQEALNQPQGWTSGAARIYYTLAQDFLYENPYRNILFLDNHDVARYWRVIGQDINKYKTGMTFILTMRGIPSIYYGTELLFYNQSDNHGHYRNDFPGGWEGDEVNKFIEEGRTDLEKEAFNFTKKLIAYRSATPALQTGKLTQFVPENGVYTYARYDDDKTILIIMNTHTEATEVNTSRFSEITAGFSKAKNVISDEVIEDYSVLKIGGSSALILEMVK